MIAALTIASTISSYAQKTAAFYVGTGDNSPGSVITLCELNLADGKVKQISTFPEAQGPGYLALSPNKKHLYSVSLANKINSYAIGANHQLTAINSQSSEGAGPCHVSVHPTGKMAFVSNYSGGTFAAYTLNPDGNINPATFKQAFQGSGPNTRRQEKAHAHYAQAGPDGKYVYVADLGSDKIMNYAVDVKTGKLTANPAQAAFGTKPGAGPRHLTITSNGKFMYILNELDATVIAAAIDKNGVVSEIKTYETIPAGVKNNISAAIHLHPNGKYVYVSNRGHNSITGYKILADGSLEMIDQITLSISTPRDFNFDPSGKFAIIGNQDKNTLTVYAVDSKTGKLTFSNESISIKSPICITFL